MDEKRDELKEFHHNPNRTTAGLYVNCRPKFIRWGQDNHRTSAHDLTDIFQQAVIIMVLNIESGRLAELAGTLCTYLFGIGKNLIQAFLRKNKSALPMIIDESEFERLSAQGLAFFC